MADYSSPLQQARALRVLALQTREEIAHRNRARQAAYAWLAREPQGQVLLDDWALVLLKPCTSPEDEGERRMILKIFAAIERGLHAQEGDDAPAA